MKHLLGASLLSLALAVLLIPCVAFSWMEPVFEPVWKKGGALPPEASGDKLPPKIPSDALSPGVSSGGSWTEPITGMEFVRVPEGCYDMGCGSWTSDCRDNEKPVHRVCLDGFLLGKYEVTQGEWKKIMGNNPANFKNGDDYPVEQVSWDDVREFIEKLNTRTSGKPFRLPTEAEWEYACRSGGKPEKYSGGNDLDKVGWYDGNSGSSTHPVGKKAHNGLGIYDMTGNVWEWCADTYASKHAHRNPIGSNRVSRGGSWYSTPVNARCATRVRLNPADRIDDLGFRLARTR